MQFLSDLGGLDFSGLQFDPSAFSNSLSFSDLSGSYGSGLGGGSDYGLSLGSLGGGGSDWMNSLSKGMGVGQQGVNLLGGVMGLYNGYRAQKLAKDQFKLQKDMAYKNYNVVKNLTNSQLADRQAQRHRRDPTKFESVESYMAKYGVK